MNFDQRLTGCSDNLLLCFSIITGLFLAISIMILGGSMCYITLQMLCNFNENMF